MKVSSLFGILFFLYHLASGQSGAWSWQNPGPQACNLMDVFFLNSQTGWAAGFSGMLLKTTDSGITWKIQNTGVHKDLRSVFFLNPLNGWAVGHNGTILKTTDGGEFWQSLVSGTQGNLRKVVFQGPLHGWIAGGDGTLLKSTDAGQTWQIQSLPTLLSLVSVHFSSIGQGVIVG